MHKQDENEWITEISGSWTIEARLRFVGEESDGIITVSKPGSKPQSLGCYRFPIGWRCSGINDLEIPKHVKAAAARAMRKLP